MALNLPPLLGDNEGRYRIQLVGNSGVYLPIKALLPQLIANLDLGSGKTTTGTALAAILGIPFISLDTIFWRPGWQQCPRDEFVKEIREVMAANPRGWIIDGNYTGRGAGFITEDATDVIWLDPPLLLYLPRLILRTFYRLAGWRPTCSAGCPETFREVFFSKDSIIWWCLSNHWSHRRNQTERYQRMNILNGTSVPDRKMRRFGGWGGEVRQWLGSVSDMVSARRKDT